MLWLLGLVAVAGVWLVVWGVLGWADDVGNEGERERRASARRSLSMSLT